jgi:hypothetical protein
MTLLDSISVLINITVAIIAVGHIIFHHHVPHRSHGLIVETVPMYKRIHLIIAHNGIEYICRLLGLLSITTIALYLIILAGIGIFT